MVSEETNAADQPPPPWQPPTMPPPQWQFPPLSPPQWQPPAPPYAAPPGWQQHYPPYGYPTPPGYPQPRDTNGFCIASLVCSLAGILIWFLGPVLGLVFGWIGIRQISRDGANGRGLAVAGIVIGAVMILLNVVFVIAVATTGDGSLSNGVTV